MRGKKDKWIKILGCMLIGMVGFFLNNGEAEATVTDYSNAREFYESTGANGYHAVVQEGDIYYATQGKLAGSSTNLKYGTVGYDITLNGRGESVSFCVKRAEAEGNDGSMREVMGARVAYGGYEYNLYRISDEKLFELARMRNATAADIVLKSPIITVYIDAIMSVKQNGEMKGGVSEDGKGGLTEWGAVYHLKNPEHLSEMRKKFTGHTFQSFFQIRADLNNYELAIQYKLDGGKPTAESYSVKKDVLCLNGSPVITETRLMNKCKLQNQTVLRLEKKGYHIPKGEEWTYGKRNFNQQEAYMPKEICSLAGKQDVHIYMIANWKPNTYTIQYHANGGSGKMRDSLATYDTSLHLRKNIFYKKGYEFCGWSRKSGSDNRIAYEDEERVKNLSPKQDGVVNLYAVWKPKVFTIYTNKQQGIGGCDTFYESYGVGWFQDKKMSKNINRVEIPEKPGYQFAGYFTGVLGHGKRVVDAQGSIIVPPDTFEKDTTIYALWECDSYTMTLDKQGGTGGLTGDNSNDQVEVTYQGLLPYIPAPVKEGYRFVGYYTEKEGKGICYYNEQMSGQLNYANAENILLYAYWIDDLAPEVSLLAIPFNWSNSESGISISGKVRECGSGLKSAFLYLGNQFDGSKRVAEDNNLDGKISFINKTEGAINYSMQAIDNSMNSGEGRTTAYYDITAPRGEVIKEIHEKTKLELDFFVTDYKIQ